jgi:hypothetical protein
MNNLMLIPIVISCYCSVFACLLFVTDRLFAYAHTIAVPHVQQVGHVVVNVVLLVVVAVLGYWPMVVSA